MYLSDKDIIQILPEMKFEVSNSEYPFLESEQVQICSIDLRLSNEFWKQKKVLFPIDLHISKLAELSPRRFWTKIILTPNESIILKPNEFILGHTNEKLTIPTKYAGKVNTRSSFARLGIETNSATDFLNPGWRGFVPLEIINKSKNSIKIYPYLGIVQIFLIPLSSNPDKSYGDDKLGNKYQNDDGGPSQWWRDKLFSQIKKNNNLITDGILETLISKFQLVDDLGLYRFEKFINSLKKYEIDNAENLIFKFAKSENSKNRTQNILLWLVPAIQLAFFALSLKFIFESEYKNSYYFVWGFTILLIAPTIWFMFYREKRQYFNKL